MNRRSERPPGSEPPVELESQFVLRLPAAPAQSLRHAIREGMTTIKDRLFISMESDMRRGTVRFDNWYLPAKVGTYLRLGHGALRYQVVNEIAPC
ncbi:Transcription initiation factor TFIID subunit 7 [Amphibalanus amphitrite]|uniref:Transcription initiation factor TFIID subunit 7 n=1 Tax=Amphibalanus amphitrite TaxID=1232801 RepID=A0A6A4V8T3_AMPAM|nr:Transcription initiation factor TFIID subunit 7 [Amphibalanus amphitrite]